MKTVHTLADLRALVRGEDYAPFAWALCLVAPLAGLLHWLESWLALEDAPQVTRIVVHAEEHELLHALAPQFDDRL